MVPAPPLPAAAPAAPPPPCPICPPTPHIGYDKSSAIAKHAHHKRMTLKAAALHLGHVDEATFDRVVRPDQMVDPL
jgi:fumarate hydratase class II